MILEIRDIDDNFLEEITIEDDVWCSLQAKAKEMNITDEQLVLLCIEAYAADCEMNNEK